MRVRTSIFIALPLAALLFCVSCGKETPGEEREESGDVVLTVSGLSPEMTTRTAAEGNVMNTLSLWLVRGEVILIHKHLVGREKEIDAEVSYSADGKSATMKFHDIPRGECTIYVVANHEDLDDGVYAVGKKIDDGFRNMLLSKAPLEDGKAPAFDDENGMPCSAVVKFSVSAGENHVSATLLRCVGRLTISVLNNIADHSLFFRGVGLSKRNQSLAYVFKHDNEIPAGSENQAFPELTGFVRVDPQTKAQVYDTYLYETTPEDKAEPLTFTLFGAVYPAATVTGEVTLGQRKDYTFDTNMTTDATLGDRFLLRSASSGDCYIGDDDGHLIYRFFSDDTELRYHRGIENFFWKFSGTSESTITNVGTGRQIKLDGAVAGMAENGSGTEFTLSKNGSGLRFSSGDYSLTIDPDKGLYGSADRNEAPAAHWLFRKVEEGKDNAVYYFVGARYEIPLVQRTMTYIDEYGVTRTLRRIGRNEHVQVTVGVSYNREIGRLGFQVEPWVKKESWTTFD